MPELIPGPSVILTGTDLIYVADVLAAALRARAQRDGGVPPRLREITAMVQAAALLYRADVLTSSEPGTTEFRDGAIEAVCGQSTTWLTVEATASLLGCSDSYVRRLCRERTLYSVKASSNGAWLVDEAAALERLGERTDEAA
ncbi:helix-turn-helix domain-containing protein [Streptomyces sp. NPDC001634]|uniref:helix-turn-helix domain-containing protein n=1 Tax=Streptomyces sp. NPDC001634 TaxID=3154390 RepID=UPI003324963E